MIRRIFQKLSKTVERRYQNIYRKPEGEEDRNDKPGSENRGVKRIE
jgi:hypothetical protein